MDIILKDVISRLITDHATVSMLLAKELKSLEIIHWSGSLRATALYGYSLVMPPELPAVCVLPVLYL